MHFERPAQEVSSLLAALTPPSPQRHTFNQDAKQQLLLAMAEHKWSTAREAYGWAWNHLGLRVSYLTVWRFFNSQGLFEGAIPRARKLKTIPETC